MYSIKNINFFPNKNKSASLQNQVQGVRLQDKLDKQNYHEDAKKVFELMTDAFKNTSQDITKTRTETSVKNNKLLEILKEKFSDLMNDKGMIAPFYSILFN